MPRLGDQHRVDAVVLQRNLFGGTQQRARLRQRGAQHLQHVGNRVDGHHVQAALHQPGGQLAGAGAQVEHLAGAAAAAASRSPPADTTGGHARRRPPPSRRTGSGRAGAGHRGHAPSSVGQSNVCRTNSPTASVSTRKPSWPQIGVDDLQPRAARQQLGQFLLQAQRVEPVGGDAADHDRHRAAAQCRGDAAAAAADVVTVQRLGQRPRSCRRRSGPPACRPGAPGSSAPRSGRRPGSGSSSPWASLANRVSSSTSPR